MNSDQQQRLASTFQKVFHDTSIQLSRGMTASDLEDWDSLNHINLIVAIEREFKVKFTTAEVSGLKNVGDLMDLLDRKTT